MYRLRIFHEGLIKTLPLQDPILTAGSAPENDIVLEGAGSPSVALRLTQIEGGYSASAAHPKSKPLWNGKRSDQFLFKPGDLMEIGSARLLLELDGGEAGKAAPHAGSVRARSPGDGRGDGGGISSGLSRLCAMVAEERDLRTLLSKVMDLLLETLGGNE